MNSNTNKIPNVLQQVRLLKNKYNELAAVTGEDFNIFSILRIKRKEVKTHTPILAELLDPHGLHRQRAAFLKLFLEICVKQVELSNKQQETAFYNKPESFRVRSEERPDQAQFDILLEKEREACIVIENKIDAKDQYNQLNRLYQDARKRFSDSQIKLIYLTLDGSPPSEKSLKAKNGLGNDLSIDDVILVSYREHIINWLEECMKLKEVQRIAPIREILFQYLDLLKELTGQPTNTRYSMELTELLIKDENYELIHDLEKAILEFKVHVQLEFWKKLTEIMDDKVDKSGIHENQEKEASEGNIRHYYNKGGKNRLYLGTTFGLDIILKQTEIALRVELGDYYYIYYGFVLFEKGKRVKSCQTPRFKALAEKLDGKFKFERDDKEWLGWKYPGRDLRFPVDYPDQLEACMSDLLDDKKRRESVQELVTEIAATVAQLKKT